MPIHVIVIIVVVVVVVLPSARGGADVVMVVVVESEWRGTLSFEVQHPREEVTWMLNSKPLSSTTLYHSQTTSTTTNDTAPTRHRVTMPDTPHLSFEHKNHPPWVHFRVWCLLNTTGTEKPPMLGWFLCLMPFPSR